MLVTAVGATAMKVVHMRIAEDAHTGSSRHNDAIMPLSCTEKVCVLEVYFCVIQRHVHLLRTNRFLGLTEGLGHRKRKLALGC
jgi:hypothetical protein